MTYTNSFIEKIYTDAAAKAAAREAEIAAYWKREATFCHAKGWHFMAAAIGSCLIPAVQQSSAMDIGNNDATASITVQQDMHGNRSFSHHRSN